MRRNREDETKRRSPRLLQRRREHHRPSPPVAKKKRKKRKERESRNPNTIASPSPPATSSSSDDESITGQHVVILRSSSCATVPCPTTTRASPASHRKSTELPEQGSSKGQQNLFLRGRSKGQRNRSSGRTTTVVAINMSHFDVVTMGPPKPILEVSEAFRSDTDALKLNLAVRSYRTEELKLYVLDVVKKAEKLMLEKGENVEYPPIEGLTAFNKITAELFLGTDHPVIQQKRVGFNVVLFHYFPEK
ncbi:hypothetical protein MRB53_013708 [Persea americana]|uniref:Uncharacterized protein n=1 Tax=Persea americana TaxID=3435 RepID=A0ACC2K984_PERAE|nr:hypothetical protein MRB53_013708 [Persea americana]